jgi:hypothetical protein
MSRIRADKFVNNAATGAPQLTFGAEVVAGAGLTGAGGINITGVCTAASASFTGNVSVGGVLTYEDVASIDSVGIITARSDVSIADKIVHTGDTNTAIRFPAADTFTVETSGSEALRVDSNQRLLVNKTVSTTSNGHSILQVASTSNDRAIAVHNFEADANGPFISLGKSRGTSVNSYTIVQDDDELGNIDFFGADGTDFSTVGARIQAEVDGTPGTNDLPGRLIFATTADGANSPTERLRITSDGKVGVGIAAPNVFGVHANNSSNSVYFKADSGAVSTVYGSATALGAGVLGTFTNHALAFYTNSTERLRIQSTGVVLVATDSARTNFNDSGIETRLQIEAAGDNDSAALSIISNAGTTNSDKRSGLLVLGRTRGTSNGATTVVVEDDQVGMIEFKGMDGTSFTTAGSIKAQVDGAVGTDDMPGRLVFSTSADGSGVPTERFRIDSAGRFATNGRAPSDYNNPAFLISGDNATLTIMGDGSTNNSSIAAIKFRVAGATTGDYTKAAIFAKRISGYNDLDMIFALDTAADANGVNLGNEKMRLTSAGKLLIGTTSDFVRGQIQVIDGGGGEITIGRDDSTVTSGSDLGHLFFASNDENGTGVIAASINAIANDNHTAASAPTALTFSTTAVDATSTTERMRIDQHGNVFFGATTNTAPFMRFSLDSGGGFFEKDANSTNARDAFVFRINGNSVGSIVTSGSNTAFNTSSSDRTLKKNFEDWTEEVLTYFKSLNPQKFNFIHQEDGTDKTKGYIAQDLVDKFPEAYPKNEETDKYSFNPSGMVPYLMKALQEAIAKIETLETQNTDLLSRVTALEG